MGAGEIKKKRSSHFPIIAKARNVPQRHRGPRGEAPYCGARASSSWCQAGDGKPLRPSAEDPEARAFAPSSEGELCVFTFVVFKWPS